jgi:hypothetical protein
MAVRGWSVEDICGLQLNRLNCDGTIADPALPENVILLHSLLDFEFTETTEDPGDSVETAANGAHCHNRRRDVRVTGYELTLRRCGIIHPAFLTSLGLADPVLDADGLLCGTKGFCSSNVCYCTGCQDEDCSDGGWSMIIWANAWESCTTGDAIRVRDTAGNTLQHVFIAPRISQFRPGGAHRRSATSSDAQVDFIADLKPNANWGNGPVHPTFGPIYPVTNGPLDCEPWAEFLSPVCYPGTCSCDSGPGSGFWAPGDPETPVGA